MSERAAYQLTAVGKTLTEPLGALTRWAEVNIEAVMAAQAEFDRR